MRPIDVVRRLCPHARPEYLAAFENGDTLFRQYGITTPERLEHFLAQVLHESGALTITTENMRYSAARIQEVWPSRPEAVKFAGDPEGLGNNVYANRMGNGPASSGDGYRYRGRGLMQTTGREAYARYSKLCGVDFVANPDLICDARYALLPALAEWKEIDGNDLADRGDIRTITKRINGGLTGYDERVTWLHRLEQVIDKVDLSGSPTEIFPVPTPKPSDPAPEIVPDIPDPLPPIDIKPQKPTPEPAGGNPSPEAPPAKPGAKTAAGGVIAWLLAAMGLGQIETGNMSPIIIAGIVALCVIGLVLLLIALNRKD